ncbi:hypothetical protein [Nitrosopumilus cobalaminigenes]|nr:hypothetical protein [Nitrosopumilus cobalaminigenes]
MSFSIFIMAITAAKMSFMIVHTINAFKMLSCFTSCTNHSTTPKQ